MTAKGKLYGIGVGPGDPSLMTLRAFEALQVAHTIAYPVKVRGERSTALDIVRRRVDVSGKDILELEFRMDPSDEVRQACRKEAVAELAERLDRGEDIAMITLGDVSVYSTYMRIDRMVRDLGYETEVVPGIPSFCHGAAKAGVPLMIGEEGLAVVSYAKDNPDVANAFEGFDNVVVMKAFNSMGEIASLMERNGFSAEDAVVVSNVGMEDEYIGPMDPERRYGYFTTVIAKKGGF